MSCPRTQHSASAGVESRTSNLKVSLTLQHLQNIIQCSVAYRYDLQKYCTQDRQSVDPDLDPTRLTRSNGGLDDSPILTNVGRERWKKESHNLQCMDGPLSQNIDA